MKVLNVAETIQGGVASYLLAMNEGMKSRGVEADFYLPRSQKEHALGLDRSFFYSGKTRISRLFRLVVFFVLKDLSDYHVVHLHSSLAGLAFSISKTLRLGFLRVPTVYCAHGWSSLRELSKFSRFLSEKMDRWVSSNTNEVISISPYEQDHAVKFLGINRSHLICNGVDFSLFKRADKLVRKPDGLINVIFVGRFDRQKGVDHIFKALKLNMIEPRFRLTMVGDFVLGDSDTEKPHRSTQVNFVGWKSRQEIALLYQQSDLMVMPSRWEGFGLVAIESMACGTPVIANDVGSLKELIGNSGKTFNIASEVDLADAVNSVSWEKVCKWKANLLQRDLKEFSSAEMCRKLVGVYNDLSA